VSKLRNSEWTSRVIPSVVVIVVAANLLNVQPQKCNHSNKSLRIYQVLNINHHLSCIADAAGTSHIDYPENKYRVHWGNRVKTYQCGERHHNLQEHVGVLIKQVLLLTTVWIWRFLLRTKTMVNIYQSARCNIPGDSIRLEEAHIMFAHFITILHKTPELHANP
jgi:hypothetical protein